MKESRVTGPTGLADREVVQAVACIVTDACDALDCPEPGRIDKMAYRSGGGVELEALSWNFETDVFVGPDGEHLSDHEALAVRLRWRSGR